VEEWHNQEEQEEQDLQIQFQDVTSNLRRRRWWWSIRTFSGAGTAGSGGAGGGGAGATAGTAGTVNTGGGGGGGGPDLRWDQVVQES
jgi:hypothetical protein